MRLTQLLQQTNINMTQILDMEVCGITSQSNQVKQGDIFVAIKGFKQDGALFIDEAIKNGAVAVLSDRPLETSLPLIQVEDLRHTQAVMASCLYQSDSVKKVAVTGTNGKTSTVFFVRQLLNALNNLTASIGTIGVDCPVFSQEGHATTPDSTTLAKTLCLLEQKGVQTVALEASSHGLDQKRLDGISFKAGAFTNLTRDHLDYHKTFEAYFKAKALLFSERIEQGGTAVLNADVKEFSDLNEICQTRGLKVLSYGKNGQELRLISQKAVSEGQEVKLEIMGIPYEGILPIYGDFQIMNILCAIGLCLGLGYQAETLLPHLKSLTPPAGRIDYVGSYNGARIFTDYAHTPDALERVLTSLRAHLSDKGRLVCLFGCGGNRDTGKRAQMGQIADKLADKVYITDDNPRFEQADLIRKMIKEACIKGIEVDNRAIAIKRAILELNKDDILILCGKGHETGQIIKDVTYVFNDKTYAQNVIHELSTTPLWTGKELKQALLHLKNDIDDDLSITGLSIDTRTIKTGDLFIALKGERTDGHLYASVAIEKGARAVLTDHLLDGVFLNQQIIVNDTMQALNELALYSRKRTKAVFFGITGSSGKTTTKEMLKSALSIQGKVFATGGNFNNQIGVPLTMAQIPADTDYAVIEMGMNHTGEMKELSQLVQPNITIITMIGSAHHAFFKTQEDIASAKAEIFLSQDKSGVAILNKDNQFFDYLKQKAQENHIQQIVSFGEDPASDFCLESYEIKEDYMQVKVRFNQQTEAFNLHFLGRHFAQNMLAVLAGVHFSGANMKKAIAGLEKISAVSGRGALFQTKVHNQQISVIDDAYNANPSSMIASIQSLGLRTAKRKIAVLGDMLELGEQSQSLHESLIPYLIQNKIDKVYCIGQEMTSVFKGLPKNMQAHHTLTAVQMIPLLSDELKEGDCVLIKASCSMNLKSVVSALKGENQ